MKSNTKVVPARGKEYIFKMIRKGRPTIKTGHHSAKPQWWNELLEA